MSRKKRGKKQLSAKVQLLKDIHREAGRIDLPANRAFRDKSKYTRKAKHKKSVYRNTYDERFFHKNPIVLISAGR